jgi:mono/diheme cytochrome c family protein
MPIPVRVSMVLLCAALLGSFASASTPTPRVQSAKPARDGVYSTAQAQRGRKIFLQKCAACHPIEFFTDGTFLGTWSGQSAHAVFTVIRTTMPQETPGALRRQEYADVLAYLLQLNKLPAGSVELPPSDEALKKVRIEAPGKKD